MAFPPMTLRVKYDGTLEKVVPMCKKKERKTSKTDYKKNDGQTRDFITISIKRDNVQDL